MNNPDPFLIVMAGGSGTRFWPKSTSRCPKQLISFGSAVPDSLLVQTLKRFDGVVSDNRRIVVTTETIKGRVEEQAPKVEVLAEPQGRNTAPCIYWAARRVAEIDPKAVMLVMPSDHYISNSTAFRETLANAIEWAAQNDDLVTLGIKPTRPETGYGYLRVGAALPVKGGSKVEAFVEKPNLEKAKVYVEFGNHLWNGGMFIWRAEVILAAFDKHMPAMKEAWESSSGKVEAAYPQMPATSIDYGIMEKADNVVSFALDCGWDDLGSWTSLESLADVLKAKHPAGVLSAGDLIAVESEGNIIDAPGKLVALLGVHDLIVVGQGNVVMVARKDRAQDIRLVVEQVKKNRPDLA